MTTTMTIIVTAYGVLSCAALVAATVRVRRDRRSVQPQFGHAARPARRDYCDAPTTGRREMPAGELVH